MECSQDYLTANMETLLEGRMIDDLTPILIKQLTEFARKRQAEKFPITRSNKIYNRAALKYGDWLALQDIPHPVVPSNKVSISKDPRLSPPGPSRRNRRTSAISGSPVSPTLRPLVPSHPVHRVPSEDEIFLMDEVDREGSQVVTSDGYREFSAIPNASPSQEAHEPLAAPNAVWTRRSSVQK